MKVRIEDDVVYSPYPRVEIPVCSFYDLAKEKLLTNPDKLALIDDVTSLTRAEVLAHMQRYAVGFRQHGVLTGDRVCVHLENSAENIIAMYGCILAGATDVMAKTSLTEGELRYQAQDSDSTHVLTDEEYTDKVRQAVAKLTMKVVDVGTGQKLGPHQTGEICFRSAYMVKSYYKRPKETAELFDAEGWCKSGDCGYYDENGRFYIVDRLKQMIKCMGEQVVPAELEELLLREHRSEVAEVSVVGLPNSEFGEAPAAAVVLTEEGSRRDRQRVADAIKATVKRNLAFQKHLYGGVFFVDSLPKTETSKIDRQALARALLEVDKTVTK